MNEATRRREHYVDALSRGASAEIYDAIADGMDKGDAGSAYDKVIRIVAEDVLDGVYTPEKIEELLWLPCCHTTGMHDPAHFRERKYICNSQKAEALQRFCVELGINPKTRSYPDCYWCFGKDSWCVENTKGQGLGLLDEKGGKASTTSL